MIFSSDDSEDDFLDPDTRAKLDRVDGAEEEYQRRLQEWQEVRQRKQERRRKIEKLESEAENAEREARSEELLPGQGAATKAATKVSNRVERLREEIEELETEEQRAAEAKEQAAQAVDEAVVDAAPAVVEALEDLTTRHRTALRKFSRAVLEESDPLFRFSERRGELIEELNALLNKLRDPDRRLNHARKHRVRSRVKAALEDPVRSEGIALKILDQLRGVDADELDEEPTTLGGGRLPLRTLR